MCSSRNSVLSQIYLNLADQVHFLPEIMLISMFSLKAPRLLHGNQSTQLILQAAFPLQQQGTFTATTQQQQLQQQQQQQQQKQQKQQLAPHRADSLSDRSATQPQ